MTQPTGRGIRPSWVVAALVTAGVLFGAFIGLVLLVQAINGGRSLTSRPVLDALIQLVIFVPAGLGLLRYNVLGRPPVRFSIDGVSVGSLNVPWASVGTVTPRSFAFLPYLVVEVVPEAKGRLAWYDRLAMSLGAGGGGMRTLWVTEQQLGTTTSEAAELAGHIRR